ncbi:hypothetical protein NMG60_11023845 [Bertholletia excelsa]
MNERLTYKNKSVMDEQSCAAERRQSRRSWAAEMAEPQAEEIAGGRQQNRSAWLLAGGVRVAGAALLPSTPTSKKYKNLNSGKFKIGRARKISLVLRPILGKLKTAGLALG